MTRGWCRHVLSSFLLITPMAGTICFAQSAPQETTAANQAKPAGARAVPEAEPQASSAASPADAGDAAPVATSSITPAVATGAADASNTSSTASSSNTLTDSTTDYTKNFSADSSQNYDTSIGPYLFKRFANDQATTWTAPARLRLVDVDWLLPLSVATGVSLATDTEFSKHLSNSPSRLKNANEFSNYGIGSMAAAAGGLYLWGHFTHNDHLRETGFLAIEAALNATADSYALKYAFGRERPLQNHYQGNFWKGDDSFPSEHATVAWAIAGVIAHEYPSPYVSLVSYGMAAAIGAARIDAKQHFPTDVLIGSTLGWFVAQQVYRRHHDPEVGGGEWETYAESSDVSPARRVAPTGSPFVELDSWIYPAIERLAALGYIRLAFLGQRPWTRIECAHLVEEASDRVAFAGEANSGEAAKLYYALQKEFASDLETAAGAGGESEVTARLESLYSVTTGINGPPLNDSRHFGQTIINNYGRPYQEGINTYDGFSGYGGWGRFTLYVRGEYQHSPSAPGFSQSTQNLIATLDNTPVQQATPITATNQFRLLDTYVAAKVADWNFAFGKQSLWWGPGEGSVLIFSDNAEPIYMFRASRVSPFVLPWIFHWLGPIKTDFFVGKLSGNEFPPRPMVHGEVITLKPTPNLELGFSRTAEFGGVGRAITPSAIFNSYFDYFKSSVLYGPNDNPGKRYGGFYFNYRLPFVRDWLSIYSDSLSDDDPSPLASPRRAGIDTGIYLTRFPKIAKLDLRVESTNTNSVSSARHGQYIYYDAFYTDMYTNKGNIIGSWIGREGTGIQAWSNYWFTPKSSLQFGYRHATVAPDFIPQGESVNDEWIKGNFWIRRVLNVQASVQHETWLAPVLASTRQTNWTSSVGISYQPQNLELPLHLKRQPNGNDQVNGVPAP
jgi:membrane-associated phospholipid phosphatase